jgi:pimeloyl-ACP methyl ester carboxylesterase
MSTAVVRTALPWMLRPTAARSAALLALMSGPGQRPDPSLVDWLTLVASQTRSTGAPGPLPDGVVGRWRSRPVSVLVGEHDRFFPPDRLAAAVRQRLGGRVDVLPGLGHLAVEEDPALVASHLPL